VSTASIDIGKIYEPAIAMLRVNNVGTSAYTFPSHYSGNNPTIYAISGTTIAFDLDNIAGHPFELQDNTLTALTSNLVHVTSTGTVSTNSAAQGKSSGTLYWRIPEGSPGTYAYQCQSHSSMVGSITVKDLSNI
jgi:plastocyanin